jgi:xanthine dehydrogenase/oxidase
MLITEMMICEVAEQLKLDPMEIRAKNFYHELQKTHFDKVIYDWHLPEIWSRTIIDSEYEKNRSEVDDFNLKNKWKKRGITLLPTKFGLAFGVKFLNQAGALVNIYADGSVLISHGGVEMGQGLHTKMIQLAANALQTPIEEIHILETATDKVPNTSATAASVSSDINGAAILNACDQLNERLKPYKDANPNGTLKDWANAAYFDRVNLSANGFYRTPDLDYNWETNTGNLFSYFVSGVAMTIVELDLFTGDHTILRSDVFMDIGKSINFSIDIGQIEGAFMQGVGLATLEECLVLSSNGALLTRGPGNYKIPGFRDVPVKLNVRLLQDKEYKNLKTVKTSKGIFDIINQL